MRLNSSLLVLITVAIACARASATESQELPRCEKSIRILHSELAPLQMEHPPTGRVELEFTIDPLGHVSDPVVVRSTEPRLDREALRSVVLLALCAAKQACNRPGRCRDGRSGISVAGSRVRGFEGQSKCPQSMRLIGHCAVDDARRVNCVIRACSAWLAIQKPRTRGPAPKTPSSRADG